MAPSLVRPEEFAKYTSEVAEFYKGDITIVNNLDRCILQKLCNENSWEHAYCVSLPVKLPHCDSVEA